MLDILVLALIPRSTILNPLNPLVFDVLNLILSVSARAHEDNWQQFSRLLRRGALTLTLHGPLKLCDFISQHRRGLSRPFMAERGILEGFGPLDHHVSIGATCFRSERRELV
jgi:hypothetical protein